MDEIHIRAADPHDRSRVFSLLRDAAVWLRARGIDYWQNWLDPPELHVRWIDEGLDRGEFLMVESEGRVIGCLRLQSSDEVFWGHRSDAAGYVHSLTIDRGLSGRGIGRHVLTMIEERLVADGNEFIRLDCGAGVGGLRRFYESYGFHAVGETVFDGEHLVLYQKALGTPADR